MTDVPSRRILVIYRYFWPDSAPNSYLLDAICGWLSEAGHKVSVLSGYPTYDAEASKSNRPKSEVRNGVEITRQRLFPEKSILRLINVVLFSLWCFWRVLFSRGIDIVWVGTTPPVILAFFVTIAAKIRGIKTIYQMQDVHPEIAIATNQLRLNYLTRILIAVDNFTIRVSDVVSVLSSDMANFVATRSGREKPILIVNNFAIGSDQTLAKSVYSSGPIKFVYAGNIGRFQNLERIVQVFSKLPEGTATLTIIGDGKAKKSVCESIERCDAKNVSVLDKVSPTAVFKMLTSFDVGVISLDDGLYKLAFPSKTHTYLSAGLYIFSFIESSSELAEVTRKRELGASVAWSRSDEAILAELIAVSDKIRGGHTPISSIINDGYWDNQDPRSIWLDAIDKI